MRCKRCILLVGLLLGWTLVMAVSQEPQSMGTKRLDLSKVHNVGNIWLRVSNYGFFGSGTDANSKYPSLEYPGGSGIDYLFRGALWFGAKKNRRASAGRKLYWRAVNPSADSTATVAEGTADWQPWMKPVIDTLVTLGFDGEWGVYEMLPAYNPLVAGNPDAADLYESWNTVDAIATASTRKQKRAEDDDGTAPSTKTFGLHLPAAPWH